jgi:hypothetical protein
MAKTRRHYHRKGQKIYIMKGCSKSVTRSKTSRRQKGVTRQGRKIHKGLRRHYSLKKGRGRTIGLTGGNCTTCQSFTGGTSSPLVGAPWSANDTQEQATSNHYAQNMYKEDPQLMMQIRGGQTRGRKGKRKSLKGGALMNLIPADLVNLGRDLSFNASSAYSSLTGEPQPVDPNVTQGQLNSSVNLNKILV